MKRKIIRANHDSVKDPKKSLLIIGCSTIVVLLILFGLMAYENRGGKITVENNTELKLEYLRAFFVDAEGPIYDELINLENLEPTYSEAAALKDFDLAGTHSNLEIRFKFENYDEMFVDAGYFNAVFDGRVKIDFTTLKDGNLNLHVKATDGVLRSATLDCNEDYTIFLQEGYVD